MENTKSNLEEVLEKIGLSKRESGIYLQLLKTGPLSPTEIATKTGIKRPNVYDSLESLEVKGLIHYEFKKKRRVIAPSSPQNLFDISKQQFDLAKEILPMLLSLDREQSFRSNIKFYQGRKAIQEMLHDYPKAKSKEVWFLLSPIDINNMVGKEFVEGLIKERIKRGTKLRSLQTAEKLAHWEGHTSEAGRRLTEIAYVPPNYTFALAMGIYDDKTLFFSSKREGFGFMVESREFAEVMRMFYDNLWRNSGKLSQ